MIQIDIAPGGAQNEDVRRCLAVLYSTPAGTAALDRDFGLSWDALDLPLPAAQAAMTAELIEKTQKYEPRVRVLEVEWQTEPESGACMPKVRCELV